MEKLWFQLITEVIEVHLQQWHVFGLWEKDRKPEENQADTVRKCKLNKEWAKIKETSGLNAPTSC